MPFKIVQTIERGRTKLVIVPSLWERNGSLWWPPKKIQPKLIKEENSKPDEKNWRVMNCVLKRTIRTYQLAETELSLMEDNSDTDVTETGKGTTMPVSFTSVPPRTDQEDLFEVMANKLTRDQGNQEETINDENVVQIISAETLNFDQILANQKIISEKIDQMLQVQTITLENQQKIVNKLATQSVQLQEISLQLAEVKDDANVTLLKDANPVETKSFTIKPIENQRDLISLDQLLADRAENKKLQKHLLFLCSAAEGQGKTCAYKLQNVIFTRDFLCQCSWAGGSRGERSKIALKDYKNVLKFFHGLIQTWDPIYTVQENEAFFKTITKNSQQRKSMKNLRTSSKRCRQNKHNLVKQKSENKGEPNDDNKETEENSMQIQEYGLTDESKEINERESMQIQEYGPTDESKEINERESMQIQQYVPNDESKEITEGESMQIQDQEKENRPINIPLNNMDDDDIEGSLC